MPYAPSLPPLIEILTPIAFLLVAASEEVGGRIKLISGALFGLALELLSTSVSQFYRYGDFYLYVGDVPMAIPLLWGILLRASQVISDDIGGTLWQMASRDALFMLMIDLSIDAVAIRDGLWSWSIRLDQGWFGVPYGNLCGWILVGLLFGVASRQIERTRRYADTLILLAPVPLTIAFGAFYVFSDYVIRTIGDGGEDWRWLFIVMLLGICVPASGFKKSHHVSASRAVVPARRYCFGPKYPYRLSRYVIHIYGIIGSIVHDLWLLTLLSAAILIWEVALVLVLRSVANAGR